MRTFTFRSKQSTDYGITMESAHRILLPQKRTSRLTIPGHSGSIDVSNQSLHDDIIITCDCAYVRRTYEQMRVNARMVSEWVSKKGMLSFSDEPDKHYQAEVVNQIGFEEACHIGRFKLEFLCEPFAYSEPKSYPIQSGVNVISYGGTTETPCLIILKNTGNFAVNNIKITAVKPKF